MFACMASCRVMEQGETWGRDLATLVGDAAHPTTPALGQGGCMALEVLHYASHSSPDIDWVHTRRSQDRPFIENFSRQK